MKDKLILLLCLIGMLSVQCKQQQKPQEETQSTDVYEGKDFTLYTLNERSGNGDASILVGASEEMIKETMPEGSYPNATNCFLLVLHPTEKDSNEKKILFDAGTSAEKLLENLAKVNTKPEEIFAIMITHCHGDHIGGLINNGQATFPNATMLFLSEKEDSYWRDANSSLFNDVKKLCFFTAIFTPNELENLQDTSSHCIIRREDGFTIKSVQAYGHTPGHTAYLINDEILIWGDITHASAIQMKYPEVAVKYDVNPEDAIASRKKIFDYLFKGDADVKAYAGMHVPTPSITTLKSANGSAN